MKIFCFDAETDGLYGQVWAIGAVVLGDGDVARFGAQVDPAVVTDPWVRKAVVPVVDLPRFSSRDDLLNGFWAFWLAHKDGADCVADVGHPVESGLFRACVELDLPARRWDGPYPMHELATALLMAGVDPDVDRREYCGAADLVRHHPVDDAMASALCWQQVAGCRP
jgi:hypothetical protein